MPILVVHNATGAGPNAPVTYSVQMSSVDDAKTIRTKFGSYFAQGKDSRPSGLGSISVQNAVTKGTRIRISIMKLIAKRYRDSNQGAKANVIGYTSRPLLKIVPPVSSSGRTQRVRFYTYIEAIQKFPVNFTHEEIGPITKRAYLSFPGSFVPPSACCPTTSPASGPGPDP